MMGTFNYDYCKGLMQNMLGLGQATDFSKTGTEHMTKVWNAQAQVISFMADMSRALSDSMVELAEKQAQIIRSNYESFIDLCRDNTQSIPTHQKLMEQFKGSAEKNMQEAKELTDICGKAHAKILDTYQNQFKGSCGKSSCGTKDTYTPDSKTTDRATRK